ncbi:MAG: hypothetical protein AAF570_11380, partial [Bacteroidota bacterium]
PMTGRSRRWKIRAHVGEKGPSPTTNLAHHNHVNLGGQKSALVVHFTKILTRFEANECLFLSEQALVL